MYEPASATPSPEQPTDLVAVQARGISVAYGTRTALHEIDLDLPGRAVTTIIGPNGSGKSTLLGVISGLVAVRAGSLEVLGGSPARSRRRVAHVMQATVTNEAVPLTVREVVAMGRYAPRGAFRRLIDDDRAAIETAMERMAIAEIATRQLRELSGGQRQRVLVAQGLAQQADLLLLDEPITGLDLPTQQVITEVIEAEVAAGRTVVLTTHDVGTAALADRVVLLSTEVVATGPPAEVLTTDHLDHAYGGHVHVLDDGTVLIDDPHMHAEHPRSHGAAEPRRRRA